MEKGRLEAFTDGVIAVIITIMVLELKPPHEATWESLLGNWPVFLSYVLSFLYLAIYWDNHHHFFHLVRRVDGMMLWANLHLAFVDIRVAGATYLLVALLWLIPDRRIERVVYRS